MSDETKPTGSFWPPPKPASVSPLPTARTFESGKFLRDPDTGALFDPATDPWQNWPRPINVTKEPPFGHIRNKQFMDPSLSDKEHYPGYDLKRQYWVLDTEHFEQCGVTKVVTLKKSGEQRMLADAEKILEQVVQRAYRGDMKAAAMILDRVYPTLKPESKKAVFQFDSRGTLQEQVRNVMQAVANGYVAPEVAKDIVDCVAAAANIAVIDELRARIEQLEGKRANTIDVEKPFNLDNLLN